MSRAELGPFLDKVGTGKLSKANRQQIVQEIACVEGGQGAPKAYPAKQRLPGTRPKRDSEKLESENGGQQVETGRLQSRRQTDRLNAPEGEGQSSQADGEPDPPARPALLRAPRCHPAPPPTA